MDVPKPVIVLLHAAGMTPQMWQGQVEAIVTLPGYASSERAVLAPWLAGLRPGKPGELSLSGAAAQLLGYLDVQGVGSAVIAGHQLGAMVALQLAATAPERVAGLVLSGAFMTPSRMALAMQKNLIRMLPNRAFAESGASKADLIKALDVIASADLAKLTKVITKVLVISGANDPLAASAAKLASTLPNGRHEVIANAGAHPNLEQPQAYNAQLLAFCAEVGRDKPTSNEGSE